MDFLHKLVSVGKQINTAVYRLARYALMLSLAVLFAEFNTTPLHEFTAVSVTATDSMGKALFFSAIFICVMKISDWLR